MIGFTVVKNTTFVLIFFSGLYQETFIWLIVDLFFSCAGVPLLCSAISRCLLMSFLERPGYVFRKPFLFSLKRISVVGMKSSECRYCASPGLYVCARMLLVTASYCCVSKETSHITVFLFLVPLIISCTLLWTYISDCIV